MQTELTDSYRHSVYMQQPDVIDADNFVRNSSQFEPFMDEAANLFCNYNMESRFGICLLHRHHDLRRDEVMVEDRRQTEGRDALVTTPRRRLAGTPASWTVVDGRLCALEYTTDRRAETCLHDGEVPQAFLDAFKALSASSALGQFLGLGIVQRDFYRDFAADERAMEYTASGIRASVVFPEKVGTLDFEPIKTAWQFRKRDHDIVASCVDLRECVKICHEGSSGHTKVHTPQGAPHSPVFP
jgi:hypothetical protein